jgi:hypothetical protein
LWASSTGNVVRDLKGKTPLSLAREAAHGATPASAAELKRLLRMDEPPREAAFHIISTTRGEGGIGIHAAEAASAAGVWLPVWIFEPAKADPSRPALLIAEPGGRAARWQEGALYQTLAARGYPVCAADVRGIGDLRPQVSPGAPGYAHFHSNEENYAWASLIFGKPMAGQRTTDLLALAAAFRHHMPGRRLVLAASGSMTAPALFAAALDPAIAIAYLHRGLISFRSILDAEDYTHSFANFIPGILNRFDLQDVARLASPRRVIFSQPVDASGRDHAPGARAHNIEWRPDGWDAAAFDAL